MEVRILTGIQPDSKGEPERHPRSEEVEGVSNDESGGCELEQMTTKTDNEPSLGG